MSVPSPRPAYDEVTEGHRARARDRLSQVLGREVRGGMAVEWLAADYALCTAEGWDAHQRTEATR